MQHQGYKGAGQEGSDEGQALYLKDKMNAIEKQL